ncbi:hypothetical protein CDAR_196121 [Caerostris darwini]|uniref:Uncharacterized protein n=1 Tax=Caerostris darwini TaxID=1538125 RepID=A0AAV4MGH0_9ARAC|nr:hypothetical protein CDAR_196121 [Caerostris darwini]
MIHLNYQETLIARVNTVKRYLIWHILRVSRHCLLTSNTGTNDTHKKELVMHLMSLPFAKGKNTEKSGREAEESSSSSSLLFSTLSLLHSKQKDRFTLGWMKRTK